MSRKRLSVDPRRRAQLQREVGAHIRTIRTSMGLTVAEFGHRCGMSKQDVSKLELGTSGTTLERYELVAIALGVPLPTLFSIQSRAA